MKHFLIILPAALLLFSSCTKETVTGGGAVISQVRSLPAFSEIQLNGEGEANIIYGTVQQVTVNGYENLLPLYETTMIGTTLYLRFKEGKYRIRNSNVTVSIVVPDLSSVRINGSGVITAKNFLDGNQLSADINGSGNIIVQDGKYNKAIFDISGSGTITANSTPAGEAVAEIQGSGRIRVNATTKLTAKISGSGNIDYWGNPANVTTEVNGSGKISKQ